ncbi:DNA polymerase ligase N-terminal domain-containing protein [Dactylosporangium sp. NPDC005555]|uniref:non-homologous end-joining DNA ligase LigD n=1 Tax=Dactylosporangium sp. NPDC005555 TaxID=3154889 RepID=UPI0033AD27D9
MAGERRFVVQRHRATRLHYDFRLEIDGVLVSWAVPKGPTLDPKVRRAAFHVEDHPMDYIDFEGVIPAGGYGGGDVIVWDAGTWEPYKDPDPGAAVAAGELHARLHGEKLRGTFVLVKTKQGKDDWLLLHKRDEHAVDGWDPEEHPRSVLSGRTSEEVLADPDRLWDPHTGARPLKASRDELEALDRAGDGDTWHVYGRDLSINHPDKVVRKQAPATRRELLRYATVMTPTVLPYMRAVTTDPAALVEAADWRVPVTNMAVIDLGGGNPWADQVVLAQLYRTAFEHLRIRAGIKVGPAIELWVPATGDPTGWIRSLARSMAAVMPELTHHGAPAGPTVLAPYSPIAAPGAPVSTPIGWDELDDPDLSPDNFTVLTVPERRDARGDLFAVVLEPPRDLPALDQV